MISDTDKSRLHVGFKQVMRALEENKARHIYVAGDCEAKISDPLKELCSAKHVEYYIVETMSELGRMCGIEVKASCAVVLAE